MSKGQNFPGLDAPGAGFEAPFALLEACHERAQRSLSLLTRLVDHVAVNGHDASAREASADVVRYFDLAAPLHHEDEELHVFPALDPHPDPVVRAAVARMRADHLAMTAMWRQLRAVLVAWRDGAEPPSVEPAMREAAQAFTELYADHIATEESIVYPAAVARLGAATLEAMGAEMQARRRR